MIDGLSEEAVRDAVVVVDGAHITYAGPEAGTS
jgi:hypothetical protein